MCTKLNETMELSNVVNQSHTFTHLSKAVNQFGG